MKPTAWIAPDDYLRLDEGQGEAPFSDWRPLYARPAPLTDEQVVALYLKWNDTPGASHADLIRAIEAAIWGNE